MRVYSVRHRLELPAFDPDQKSPNEVTLEQAARRLNLSPPSVRKMIEEKTLLGYQVVECAPWQIPVEGLDTEAVRRAAANLRNRVRIPRSESCAEQRSIFPES